MFRSLVTGSVLSASLLIPAISSATVVAARSADDFVESCGICTHLEYTDKPYYNQWAAVRQQLLDLGVRHIRDGSANDDFVTKIKDLYTNGVRTIWVLDPGAGIVPTEEFWTPSLVLPRRLLVDFLKIQGLTNAISAVEIMNEIDIFYNRGWISDYTQAGYFWKAGNTNPTNHINNDSASPLWWGRYIVAMASNTWNVLRADAATANMTIIGPSFGSFHDKPPTGTNSLRDFVDWGCFHPYCFGGNSYSPQETYASVYWYIGQGQQPSCNIDEWPFAFAADQPGAGNKPMAATETGWFTGTATKAVSEAAQAKYVPRLYLEYFLHGIKRCCHYELVDESTNLSDTEGTRGLLRYDLSPKPAYTALKNLLTLLEDPGPAFTPGSLAYNITKSMPSGYTRPQYVRTQLFQKRDGTFWMVLYHEIASSSYTTVSGANISGVARDITHPDVSVTVSFNSPIAQAVVYRPNNSITPTATYVSPRTLTLAVNDDPLVLQLTPSTAEARSGQVGLESFDYALNSTIQGRNGGTGWSYDFYNDALSASAPTAWYGTSPNYSGGSATVSSNGLSMTNCITYRNYSSLNSPSNAVAGLGRLYFSFDLNVDSNTRWAGLSSWDFGTERVFFGMPYQAGPARYYGIYNNFSGMNNNQTVYSANPVSYGQTHNLIALIDYDIGILKLWVDSRVEDAPHVAAITFGDRNWSTAIRLGTGSFTTATGPTVFDNVKVGTTFASVAPAPPSPAGFTIVSLLPNQQIQLTATGSVGAVYYIESSSNLLSNWTLISTVTNSTGTFQFSEPVTNLQSRFYRTRS